MTTTDTAPAAASTPTPAPAPADDVSGDDRFSALEAQVRDLARRVENNRLVRDTWTLIIFAVAAVALLAAVVAVGFGMRAIDEAEAATTLSTVTGTTT